MAIRSLRDFASSSRATASSIPASRKGSWSWSSEGRRKRSAPPESVMPRRARRVACHGGNPAAVRTAAASGTGAATHSTGDEAPLALVVGSEGPELLVPLGDELLDGK